jgi:hypothetical protein
MRACLVAVEASVTADPEGCFTFDGEGFATLSGNGRTYGAGRFSTPSIAELRRILAARPQPRTGTMRLFVLQGEHEVSDIGALQASAPPGTLFQVASQFNCLEAPGNRITRVQEYPGDLTQGPRASVSAFPGTFLRHYRAPGPGGEYFVQDNDRCINLLQDLFDPESVTVRSGYLTADDVRDRDAALRALEERYEHLRVGVHEAVEVVYGYDWSGPVPLQFAPRISQVFTSTIALGGFSSRGAGVGLEPVWRGLLRGAYEGTLLAAMALKQRTVVLTMIGGGVFGNPREHIWAAIFDAMDRVQGLLDGPLDVVVTTRSDITSTVKAEIMKRQGAITVVGRVRD